MSIGRSGLTELCYLELSVVQPTRRIVDTFPTEACCGCASVPCSISKSYEDEHGAETYLR